MWLTEGCWSVILGFPPGPLGMLVLGKPATCDKADNPDTGTWQIGSRHRTRPWVGRGETDQGHVNEKAVGSGWPARWASPTRDELTRNKAPYCNLFKLKIGPNQCFCCFQPSHFWVVSWIWGVRDQWREKQDRAAAPSASWASSGLCLASWGEAMAGCLPETVTRGHPPEGEVDAGIPESWESENRLHV